MSAILIADDDRDVLKAARLALGGRFDTVDLVDTADAIEAVAGTRAHDLYLLDMNFACGERTGREGLDLLDTLRRLQPAAPVVLMTAYGGVELAVAALKRGATDFILKPWRNERLLEKVCEAVGAPVGGKTSSSRLGALERDAVTRALERADGNISRAASLLGISRQALYRRMSRHGL